jgi:cell division protein ZapA (FtsZ GTPase activity inhibitor)
MSKEIKAMRGQLRQIAKEILPEVLAGELFAALQKEQAARLTEIARMVTERLNQIEERSKDVQSFIMREVANKSAPTKE